MSLERDPTEYADISEYGEIRSCMDASQGVLKDFRFDIASESGAS